MADKPESGNWREKYLDALDQQEQLERDYGAQQELLRRALVRVSVAADGQDDALDAILGSLRERMRGTLTADINALLNRLDQAVLGFEQHRQDNALRVREALAGSLRSLQEQELSRAAKKDIAQFLAQLPDRAAKVRLYPAMLEELANLQQQALKELAQPKTGFLQKILGKTKEGKVDDMEKIAETAASGAAIKDEVQMLPAGGFSKPAETSVEPSASADSLREYAAPDAHFSAPLVARLAQIINQFLSGINAEAPQAKKVEELRERFHREMSGALFIDTLEHLRDLVMQAYLTANRAFASYLQNVNQELADIYAVIGGSVESGAKRRTAADAMQQSMLQEMANLEAHAGAATDLAALKLQVKSRLGNIRQALDHYQQAEQQHGQLMNQLQQLGDRVKSMEMDAEKNRKTLEKQRYKALHDPLTELPNREFYNERAAYELQRWQRYNRPLTLAVFDIDHFKNINDTHGHQAGDRVLKVIGRSIAKRLREVDFFCRFGGEEFIALMPETTLDEALPLLEKIRASVAGAAFNYKEQPIAITLSIGVTEFKNGDDLEAAFTRADQALYKAKSQGRNCLRSA